MKKNKMKKLAPLALVGLLTIGASAWLTTTDLADKSQSITAGTFAIKITSETDGILDENAIPVSDEVGKASTAYTFTVQNTGTIKQAIRLAIVDKTGDLSDSLVNLYITDKDGKVVYESTLADADKDNGFGEPSVLVADGTQTYTVRAWIDDAAVNTDLYGADGKAVNAKEFKLMVLGVQADGGIDGSSTSPVTVYSASDFEQAATNSGLTRNKVGD